MRSAAYVFEVSPKKIEKDKRYFEGTIWVDDRDLQIVKTYGKAVPDRRSGDNENLFPKFETYREQIDGEYWFPTYTRIADTLDFKSGPLKMRGDCPLRRLQEVPDQRKAEVRRRSDRRKGGAGRGPGERETCAGTRSQVQDGSGENREEVNRGIVIAWRSMKRQWTIER